tara:strand:- start:957 stop:5822 length:4866 start_codon:yes stop_codon:yes gene_type:complete
MDEKVIELEDKVIDTNIDKFSKWFKDNPEKILGDTLIKTSTIRGKENAFTYTTVISDKEKLFALNIPDYMQVSDEDPLVSTEKEDITETKATPKEIEEIKSSSEKSENKINQIESSNLISDFIPSSNIWSYEDVDKTYNGDRYNEKNELIEKAISESEKQAYVLYLKRFTGKEIKGGFKKYLIEDTKENRLKLMKEGSLAFDNTENEEDRRFKPSFYYASGNIRQKLQELKGSKDFYVNNFGEDVYSNQLSILNEKLEIVNENKLSLTSDKKSKRIYIKVDGGFAIKTKVYPCIPINKESYERGASTWIRLNKDGNIEWKVNEVAKGYVPEARSGNNANWGSYQLTLREAFIFWYKDFNRYTASDYDIIYPKAVDYDLVMDWFVNGKNTRESNIPDNYKRIEGRKVVVKDTWLPKLQEIKNVGNDIFALFLKVGLQEKDVIKIEDSWNTKYNSFLNYNVNKVPVLFQFVKNVGFKEEMDIRTEKRRAIGFNMLTGSSCLAYGVGMGKTFASIFTLGQNLDLGLCKRPLIIVPNSVYPQFLQEIKFLLPQYKINALFNLKGILSEMANSIEDNTITIISKSAIDSIGFEDNDTGNKLLKRYEKILDQGADEESFDEKTEKKRQDAQEKLREFLGLIKSNATVSFDKVGWDYLCVDEAHNYKNLFTSVKAKLNVNESADLEGNEVLVVKRPKSSGFSINGSQSITAVKMFAIAQYVQMNNKNGNCLLLTATPFTNTPLEVYAILSLIRWDFLNANGYGSIQDFFEFFAEIGNVSAVTTTLKPINKMVVTGFKNVVAMQGIIYALIDKPTKEEEASKVRRPNKIVLPLWDKRVGNENLKVSDSNQITTLLKMTPQQSELWERLSSYAEGKIKYAELSSQEYWNNSKCSSIKQMLKNAQKKVKDGESPADYDSGGIQSVFALTYGRTIALSPYLYRFFPVEKNPTPAEFVQASPKIEYAIECIKTVKEHHEKTKTPMSGQVIFMTKGVSCFNLITDYCVQYLGLKQNEVGIIASENFIGKKKVNSKDIVQDSFLGRRLDLSDPLNPKYVDIPDEERVKVLVGSTAIKEGVNLQFYSTCLYVCEVDWNPTDMTQLEGRIWRQKNAFANVRIVIPLLENSLDAFIYNKLREKTGRINEIWERDGSNEFDVEQLDNSEMTRQVSRSPLQIADLIKKEMVLDFTEKITEQTSQYNSFRKVRTVSGEVIDVYNLCKNYSGYKRDNPLQIVWNFLNTFRPSLIDKPLVKDLNQFLTPTSTQESRQLKVNPNGLNYSFEDLTSLMSQFRKDAIIEYPRGYMSGWKEEKEKPIPTFKVGEKVTFETRRGAKEGKIFEVFSYNYGNEPKNLEYDIQVGLDPDNISEGVKTIDNKIVSLDNPIKEVENVDLGGTAFNIGSKKAIETIKDIKSWFLKTKTTSLEQNLEYYNREDYPFGYVGYNIHPEVDSFLSFNKISNYFLDEYLIPHKYVSMWTFWVKEINSYWEKLIPLGIKNEDELTIKLKTLKESISILKTKIDEIDTDEYFEELKKRAILEIKERAELGDEPLSPIKCAKLFASSNADYKGNEYLDIFDSKYLKNKESKIEEAKVVEEKPKELSLIDKKIKVFEMLVKTSKGAKKDLLEKKINVFKMFRK